MLTAVSIWVALVFSINWNRRDRANLRRRVGVVPCATGLHTGRIGLAPIRSADPGLASNCVNLPYRVERQTESSIVPL
jgi:hypothetical protein